jgi:hypothetical protein
MLDWADGTAFSLTSLVLPAFVISKVLPPNQTNALHSLNPFINFFASRRVSDPDPAFCLIQILPSHYRQNFNIFLLSVFLIIKGEVKYKLMPI